MRASLCPRLVGPAVALGPESNAGQPEACRVVGHRQRVAVAHRRRPIRCWTHSHPIPPPFAPLIPLCCRQLRRKSLSALHL